MNHAYKNEYPFNLIRTVLPSDNQPDRVDDVYLKGFHAEVAKLPEKFQTYIKLRYIEQKSRNRCATEMQITLDQARRVESDVCHQLLGRKRHLNFTAVSLSDYKKLERDYKSIQTENETLRALLKNILNKTIDPNDIIVTNNPVLSSDLSQQVREKSNLSIHDVGFTNRIYNALGRRGIETLGEVANHTQEQIMKTRGISQKGIDEITNVLMSHGLSFSEKPYEPTSHETLKPLTEQDIDLIARGFYGTDILTINLNDTPKNNT